MRPNYLVAGFMIVWLSMAAIFSLVGVSTFFSDQRDWLLILMPVGMLVFGLTLSIGIFWNEVKKQKPMLMELFKGIESQ